MAYAIPLALGYSLFGLLALVELRRTSRLQRRVNKLRQMMKDGQR